MDRTGCPLEHLLADRTWPSCQHPTTTAAEHVSSLLHLIPSLHTRAHQFGHHAAEKTAELSSTEARLLTAREWRLPAARPNCLAIPLLWTCLYHCAQASSPCLQPRPSDMDFNSRLVRPHTALSRQKQQQCPQMFVKHLAKQAFGKEC